MAKTYVSINAARSYVDNQTSATANGGSGTNFPRNLVYQGPTLGNHYRYSDDVNGTTTFFVVDNGPTLGRQRSAT